MAAIGVVAFGVAAAMLFDYARAPDGLWRDALKDNNAYLASAMTYAGAWRSFDLVEVVLQTARSVIWPPFHGIVLGFVLLPWMDYRLGPVVSLAGWWMTVFVAALIAQRMCGSRLSKAAAATLTAIFVIASPAFRLLGSDVMLEGLGAGLSALALLLYLCAMERPDETVRWRWLALILTCLFFEKYNYWAMLLATLVVAFASERSALVTGTLRGWFAAVAPQHVVRVCVRDPLLIAGVAVSALVAILYALKPAPVMLLGKPVGIYPPENLTTVAYALLFTRLALLWRKHRAGFDMQVGPGLRIMAYWHAAPILISFLIPKRISGFAWFLGASNSGVGGRSDPWRSAEFQWPGFAKGFHVDIWSAVLVVTLAAVGAFMIAKRPAGARAIALFPLVSAVALLIHPQQQWRFQTTWLFGVWICAGVGGALLLTSTVAGLRPRLQAFIVAGLVSAIGLAHAMQPVSDIAAAVAIRKVEGPSDMELARAYLPHIAGTTPVGFLTSFGRSDFFTWTVRSDCGCDRPIDAPFNGTTSAEARGFAEAWVLRTPARQIVVIDAPGVHEIESIGTTAAVRRGALDVMTVQTRFRHVVDVRVAAFDATVSIWQRD